MELGLAATVKYRDRGLALLGLFLVVGTLFSGALFGGRVFFQRDVGAYWYARTEALVGALAEGAWPLPTQQRSLNT
jgi:hypothetical protein